MIRSNEITVKYVVLGTDEPEEIYTIELKNIATFGKLKAMLWSFFNYGKLRLTYRIVEIHQNEQMFGRFSVKHLAFFRGKAYRTMAK